MKQKLTRSVAFVLTFVMAFSLIAVTQVLGEIPEGPEHSQTLIGLELVEVGPAETGGTLVDIYINLLANPAPGIFSLPGFLMPGRIDAAGEFIWNENIATLASGSGANGGIWWNPPGSVLADVFGRPAIVAGRCWQRTVFQTLDIDDPYTYYGPLIRLRFIVPENAGTVVFRYGPNPVMAAQYDVLPYVRYGDGGYINVDFAWHVDVVFEAGGTGEFEYHTVTFEASEGGTIPADAATVDVRQGAAIAVGQVPTPVPAAGFVFDSWSPEAPAGVVVTAPLTFVANFVADGPAPENHLVTFATEGNGTVAEATREVAAGTTLTLADMPAATPGADYVFSGWSPDPAATPITAPITFTATFTPDGPQPVNHVVTFNTAGEGTVSETTREVLAGTTLTLADMPTATPAEGHEFVNWSPDPAATPINAATTFTATFRLLPVGPRVIGDVNGDGVIDATDLMYIRTHITFPAANFLAEHIFFADINGDGVVTAADLQILRTYIYSEGTMRHRNIGQTAHVPAAS